MGCAVLHGDGVYVFEMIPQGVSGCDVLLISAHFEPVVRALFGDAMPSA